MIDPAILSDPTVCAIAVNVISTGISAGISKLSKQVFSPQDITGFLNRVQFKERLQQEIYFEEEISTADLRNLETFILDDHITDLISQIYGYSDITPTEIETEFVQVFCAIKPIGEKSTDAFARKLFFGIKLAANNTLYLIIKQEGQGGLLAHEYKDQERHKEDGEHHQIEREMLANLDKKTDFLISFCQAQKIGIAFPVPIDPPIEEIAEPKISPTPTQPPSSEIGVQTHIRDSVENIDAELEKLADLIKKQQFEVAKTTLFEITGYLNRLSPENEKQLAKTHHLLAVTYNRNKQIGGNFDIAEQHANLSLKYDPSNEKVKGCLASILINKHGKANYDKSFGIAAPLWEKSDQTNPQFLEVYLWGIFFTKSAPDAISFFETSEKAQHLVEQHDLLSNLIARFYILIKNPREALKHINISINLDPENPDHYAIKASAYREISLMEDWLFSDFEVCPRLKKRDCLEKALTNYQISLRLCKEDRDVLLQEQIKKDIYSCSIILNRTNQSPFNRVRFSINPSFLPENEQKSLDYFDFLYELNNRNFSTAYNRLINMLEWNNFPYPTKVNLAIIFLKRGCPEESRKILKSLESEAEKQKDIQIWINLSYCEALLNNKVGLLQQLEKAKHISSGSKNEEGLFHHIYAMINRYSNSGKEIDRMLSYLQEHDQKFPQQKLLKAIPVSTKEEKPPREIIDLCKNAIERDQKTKKIFTEHQVPINILAGVHRLTYPELMTRLKDPNFHLRYYPPDFGSQREIIENFNYGELLVLDYSSLLNLAKMDLLWELEKFPGKLLIATSLFNQIQSDLVYYENSDLRKLWDFLRLSGRITIVDVEIPLGKYDELIKYVDKWIVDSFDLVTITEKTVLVSDDYNLIRLLKSQNCKGTTTYTFLKFLLDKGFIDPKTYGVAFGVLADQMYVILPFDGEDLFYVVIDDDCKITVRSYHMINHISIPEIRPSTYTQQFDYFLEKLWKTGALPDDKINWLTLITERVIFAINQRRELNQMAEVELLLVDIIRIWEKIIPLCTQSDLSILETKCYPFIEKESSKRLLEYLPNLINQRKEELSQVVCESLNNSGE